jgi:hypothetical protein
MEWNSSSSARTLSLSDYPYENFLISTNVFSSGATREEELTPFFERARSLTFVGSEITEDVVGTVVKAAAGTLSSLTLRDCNFCFMSGQVRVNKAPNLPHT